MKWTNERASKQKKSAEWENEKLISSSSPKFVNVVSDASNIGSFENIWYVLDDDMTHLFWHRCAQLFSFQCVLSISLSYVRHFFSLPLFFRLFFVICKQKPENRKKLFITQFTQWLAQNLLGTFVGMSEHCVCIGFIWVSKITYKRKRKR